MFDTIRNKLSSFISPAPLRDMTGEDSWADPYRLYPEKQFTAYNPDQLVRTRGLDVYEKMRTDEQVKIALLFKKYAVISSGWTVESPEGTDPDWEVTEFCRYALGGQSWADGILERSLDSIMFNILTAMDFGFSISEKIFAPIESGAWKGKVGIKNIKTRKPKHFEFSQDEHGNLDEILQNIPSEKISLPPEKFIVFSHNYEFDNPYGKSDLREAYRAWWSKDHAYKWLGMMLEKFGIPPIFFFYNPQALNGQPLENLKTIMKRMQSATFGTIPRTAKGDIEAWSPENMGDNVSTVFIPALKEYDTAISKAILTPGLLGISPEQISGSLARAKVAFDVFMFAIEQLRGQLEGEVMQRNVIKPLVDLNFANVTEYPIFKMMPIADNKQSELLKVWADLIGEGAVIPSDEDEDHIREVLEFPARINSRDDIPDPDGKPDPDPEDDKPDPEKDDPEDDDETELKQLRQANRYEKKVDLVQITKDLDKKEIKTLNELRNALEAARDLLMRKLKATGANSSYFKQLKQLKSKAAFSRILQEHLIAIYNQGRRDLRKEVKRSKNFDIEDASPHFIPRAALKFIRENAISISSTTDQRILGDVKQAILKSIELGETGLKASERLSDVFKPFVGDPIVLIDGNQMQPWRLENIVRTESTKAYANGRLIEARDPDLVGLIAGMEYSAIMDSRTTEVCRHLDGKIFKVGDPNLDKLTPPNHYMCRSTLVPITIADEPEQSDYITEKQTGSAMELALKGFV